MKTLIKKSSEGFEYMKAKFPKIPEAKLKEDIRRPADKVLLKDNNFLTMLDETELKIRDSFKLPREGFLGNKRSLEFRNRMKYFLDFYAAMGCRVSVRVQFLGSHLDFFAVSGEQGKHFYQDIL